MVSESGAALLEPQAKDALIAQLLPRATVVTPNVPEARALTNTATADVNSLARAIRQLGPQIVVVTGGHREQATDTFFDGERLIALAGPRYATNAAHGSGCTHSSVLAARLALADDPLTAATTAKHLAARAVRDGLRDIGAGAGPVNVLGNGLAANLSEASHSAPEPRRLLT
jgi:hydroxymethylpyrimidine/phosphomethylpyrimidine kinase